MFYVNRAKRSDCRGVTMIELAIVMGLAGVFIGGIWVGVSNYMNASRVSNTSRQMMKMVENIREHYMGGAGVPNACLSADITNAIVAENILPPDVVNMAGNVFTAVGRATITGGVAACTNGTGRRFRITLNAVRQRDCIKILHSGVNYQDSSLGITMILSNGTWSDITCNDGICGVGGTPWGLNDAVARCPNDLNTIGWEFMANN